MAYPSGRRISGYGTDDYLSDELPDYSSRRSSYNGSDQRSSPYDDKDRKVSTSSNMLEVPGSSFERNNSLGSTSSLVSNSSTNSFSYRVLNRPKIRSALGCLLVLIGLCLLVLGVLLLIFGHKTSVDSLITNDHSTDTNASNTTTNANDNNTVVTVNTSEYHVSPLETIGYFALFSGILLILIGISIITHGCRADAKTTTNTNPKPSNSQTNTQRRVSTIEIETPINSSEIVVNKPEIMITTDNNNRENVSYKKFPVPIPQPTLIPRASISNEEHTNPLFTAEYHKRYEY